MLERLVLYQDWLYVDTEAGIAYRKVGNDTKGVSYDKARSKWVGHVTIHGDTHQRRFATEQEAADWVVYKRQELHGEYAKA